VDKSVTKKSVHSAMFLFANRTDIDDIHQWKFRGTSGQRILPDAEASQGTATVGGDGELERVHHACLG